MIFILSSGDQIFSNVSCTVPMWLFHEPGLTVREIKTPHPDEPIREAQFPYLRQDRLELVPPAPEGFRA